MSIKVMEAAVNFYKVAPKLTHKQEVMRLYRRTLRTIFSWSESRLVFNDYSTKIRAEFNENMHHAPDSGTTVRLMREARERLFARTHPDPYIAAYMPGGSLFMRNAPPPLALVYPDGIPEGVRNRRVNIDMSNVPDEDEYGANVFVDSANKIYFIDK